MKTIRVLLFFHILLYALTLYAQNPNGDITVKAEGYGASENEALLDAKRNAIGQGIGTPIISQTEIENYALKKDLVLSQTVGAVKKYAVLNKKKSDGDLFHIEIEAVVSVASIKANLVALKILLESMNKPRMMVVIRETGEEAAASAIIDYLRTKGFDIADASQAAVLKQKDDAFIQKIISGDPTAAAKLGASDEAEYIIVGEVTKSVTKNDILAKAGLQSGQAVISAKVVNCSDGRIIASQTVKAAAVHISEKVAQSQASQKAGLKLMEQTLFDKIIGAFQSTVNDGMAINVTVENVNNYKLQKEVSKLLGSVSGVRSLNKRSFTAKQLRLSIVYQGSADSFSDKIDGKKVKGKTLAVTAVAGNSVTIDLE